MNEQDVMTELQKICDPFGPKAAAYISLQSGATRVSTTLYPAGITGSHDRPIYAAATTIPGALSALREAAAERIATANAATVRKMAIIIMEATLDHGACTESHLRVAGFSDFYIRNFGEVACSEASRLSTSGPYKIIRQEGNDNEAA